MSFGPPAGSPFASPGGGQGLPFAGIPPELQARVERLLEDEPTHHVDPPAWTPAERSGPPFTLRRFLSGSWGGVAVAGALVLVETVLAQSGPLLSQIAIDDGIRANNTTVLWRIAIAYALVITVSGALGGVRVAFTARLGERLMERLRVRVFSHLQRLSVDYFTDEKAGVIMTRMTSDIDNLSMLFQEGLVQIGVQGLAVLVISIGLFIIDPGLAAFTILIVIPTMIGLTLWFRSASNRGFDAVRDRIAALLSDLSESLGGIRVITATNRREHNIVNHMSLAEAHLDANLYTAKVGAIYGPATESLGIVSQAAVLGVGATLVAEGSLTVGQLVAFLLYVNLFFTPIQQLVQQYNTYQQGQSSVRKLRELLANEPTVAEAPDARVLPPISGTIEFDRVSFSYLEGQSVLDDVTLRIDAGETFAFVGPTGAGKSTLAKLVVRFMDPTGGAVRIDGTDLREVTFDSLRRQLGVVPQEPFLFSGSIIDNLRFAQPGLDPIDVRAACDAVGLGPMLDRLPEGLDTPCHDRGGSFSSGERQLLALARAFLAQPRVLVLDEATSSLDLASERQIEAALDVVLQGRTAIIIAHRLSTAMLADRIAVIDDGGVAELGTHSELVALGGEYALMYSTWQQHSAA